MRRLGEASTRRGAAALAAGLALSLPAGPAAAGPKVLYLNFSDGTEEIARGESDDASRNQSAALAADPYPPFSWPGLAEGTVTRRDLVRAVARRVHEAFLPYDVVVTVTRPATGPYTMVLIGGSPALFGLEPRVAGLALMDCDDRNEADLAFVFPSAVQGSLHGLAVTIAQEAAHAFGLEHTGDPHDFMYPRVDPRQSRFLDREVRVEGEPLCGQPTQNSHRRLLEVVGPWPGGEKPPPGEPDDEAPRVETEPPAPGCSAAPPGKRFSFAGLLLSFLGLAVGACSRPRRRL